MGKHRRTSAITVAEQLIDEGHQDGPIRLRTYSNGHLPNLARCAERRTVVMGNGAFKTRGTVERFIRDYLQDATRHGQAIEFVTYDDPEDIRTYTAEAHLRRFGRAAWFAASRNQNKLQLVGHSTAASEALQIGLELQERLGDRLLSATLLTPAGYAPDEQPKSRRDILGRAVREAKQAPKTIAGLGSLAVMASLFNSMRKWHASSSERTYQMAEEALTADEAANFVAARKQASFDVNTLLAGNDAFFPARTTKQTLVAADLPDTHVDMLMNATHLSTITDYRNGAAASRFMNAQLTADTPWDQLPPPDYAAMDAYDFSRHGQNTEWALVAPTETS